MVFDGLADKVASTAKQAAENLVDDLKNKAAEAANNALSDLMNKALGELPIFGNLVRAKLIHVQDPDTFFEFLINPSELTFTKENSWSKKTKKGYNVPRSEFLGGLATTFELSIILDTSEVYDKRRDVNVLLAPLLKMSQIDSNNRDNSNNLSSPSPVRFEWGVFNMLEATFVITRLTRKYTRFDPDAKPTRVEVQVALEEYSDRNTRSPQNPTSGGTGEQSLYRVRPGQTLDLIAYEVLGDATRWREIANANKLDDPLALRAGQLLSINF